MNNSTKRLWAVRLLALLGLGLSIWLAIIYYNVNYSKTALYSFCAISEKIDCDGVAKTYYSQFLGIPLAWWGIFLYVFMLFMTIVDKIKWQSFLAPLRAFKSPLKYLSALGLISFAISMCLAWISYFKIEKICLLCFTTYFVDLLISVIATDFKAGGYIESFKTSFKDFIDGVNNYKTAFIICLIAAIGFLAYSETTFKFIPHLKYHKSIKKYIDMKHNEYRITGNTLGDPNGKVKVIVITDFVCPMCRINNILIHRAVKEYKNISVTHYNYPLDKACNKKMRTQMHPGACMMSQLAIAAKNQGHYWDMASELYDKKPKKTQEIFDIAKSLGMDEKRFWIDAMSEETAQKLDSDLRFCETIKINATPTTIINGEKIVGLKRYEELVEILKKYGAEKRGWRE